MVHLPPLPSRKPPARKRARKIALTLTLSIVILVASVGILGGGWGDKPPLPASWRTDHPPLLLAHRGVTDALPENSTAALDRAVTDGFDGLEVDLQFSRDSIFILAHDLRADRLLGIDTVISDLAYDEISQRPLLFDQNPTSERIPRLEDILTRYQGPVLFYFDMKRHGHDSKKQLARDIAAIIGRHNLYESAVVASAHLWFISYLEYRYPRVVTVLEGINPHVPWLYKLIPTRFRTDLIASRYATITDDFAHWLRTTGMNERYITYHMKPSAIDTALGRGIQMFIIDYADNLNPYLESK